LLDADQDFSLIIQSGREGLERSAAVLLGKTGVQVESYSVMWANDLLCSDESMSQRAVFVRACRFGCINVSIECVEYSDGVPANLKYAALTCWDFSGRAQIHDETA